MSGNLPQHFFARNGAGRGSSSWKGLSGCRRTISLNVLARPVTVEIVPRDDWERIFRAQGMSNPSPRIRMLDGFNESWIEFHDRGRSAIKGATALESVIAELVNANQAKASA